MTSRLVLYIALIGIALVVLVMSWLRVFSSELVVAAIVVLYIVVSLINRRKFRKQEKPKR